MIRRFGLIATLALISCESKPFPASPVSASPPPIAASVAPTPLTPPVAAAKRRKLYLQPLGKSMPTEDVAFVKRALDAFWDLDVVMLAPMTLPEDAWYAPRKRYRAEILLEHLWQRIPADGDQILGLVADDISTTRGAVHDWGILGLAAVDGKVCVISSHRTKRGATSKEHARIRLGKVAVHEIGHTLGLPHCPNRGCLMEDARGTVKTTDREKDLCFDCRAALKDRGIDVRKGEPLPW